MPPNGICVVVGPLERAWFFSLTGVRGNTPLKLEKLYLPQAFVTLPGHPLRMTLLDWLRSKS